MKRTYSSAQVRWLVGQHHVMKSDFTIARDITKRTKTWPRPQRVMAIRDAIKAHHENRRALP